MTISNKRKPTRKMTPCTPPGRHSITHLIFGLIISALILPFAADMAHATTSEVKLYCKNKCQYDLRQDCYEKCIQEETQGSGTEEETAKTWEELVEMAEQFYERKEYDQAISVYEELLKMDPLAELIYYNMGICFENMGEFERAIENYKQYLKLKPYADDRPEVEAWIRRLMSHPEQEKQRYQTFTIATSPVGKVKLRLIQNSDVRLRVDIITPEPFDYKIVERVEPPSVSLRAYLKGYVPTREVIPVWRGGIKEILLHWEQDVDENDKRSYLLVTIRLDQEPRNPEPFSGFTDGYVSYDAEDNQIYTFDMADDERRFSFVFDIHLLRESTFMEEISITQVPLKDLCEIVAQHSNRSCIIDYRLWRLWAKQDRSITYSAEKIFMENLLDYFANQFNFRWVETDEFYVILGEQAFEWLAQNSLFYYLRPEEEPDLSAYVLDPVTFDEQKYWDVLDYFSNWHYISFKESVIWRLKDASAGGEGIRTAGVLQGGPTLEDFLTAFAVANSLFWFRIWDSYFITDRTDRIGRFVELAGLGEWNTQVPVEQPARFGFDDFNLSQKSRYYFRWGNIFLNHKHGAWALREFEKSIDRSPESEDNYFFAGVACLLEGRHELAIRGFQRAVRLRPDFVMAHYMLARAYEHYDDLRDAVEHYKLALTHAPDFAPAARDLGILYMHSGLLSDSIEYLRRAVDIMPADMEAQYELSRALYFHGEYEEAWNHLIVARPTEYVALSFPQIQRRLIFEFGQLWHKEWYEYKSGWYYKYPKNYYEYPGWYYNKPDWATFNPGYYQEDNEWYRAHPEANYYPYFDKDVYEDDSQAEYWERFNKNFPDNNTGPGLRPDGTSGIE